MRTIFKKILCALPFCVPFPFILLCDFYYKQSYIRIIAWAVFIILDAIYDRKGWKKEMLAGSAVGAVISVIITSIVNNGFDESRFAPLDSITTVIILALVFFVIKFLGDIVELIIKKINKTN